MAALGTYTVCFVWAMEAVSGPWKTYVGMGMGLGFTVGKYVINLLVASSLHLDNVHHPCWVRLVVSAVSYISRDWKLTMCALSAVNAVAFILMARFIPESPRWLMAQGTREARAKAETILAKAAEMNGLQFKGSKEATDGNEDNTVKFHRVSVQAAGRLHDSLVGSQGAVHLQPRPWRGGLPHHPRFPEGRLPPGLAHLGPGPCRGRGRHDQLRHSLGVHRRAVPHLCQVGRPLCLRLASGIISPHF